MRLQIYQGCPVEVKGEDTRVGGIMKRDMDLIRAILLDVEQQGPPEGWCDVQLRGHSEEEISYHVMLLRDAGLVEAVKLSTQHGVCWRPKRLTYEGDRKSTRLNSSHL